MPIYSEETVEIGFGSGLYSADLPSAIPDGFCASATNVVPTGTSIESRYGFRKSAVDFDYSAAPSPDREEIYFSRLESNQNSSLPAMMWGGRNGAVLNNMFMVRDGSPLTNPVTPTITDGYSIFNLGAKGYFRGSINYNGRIYFNTTAGVYRINALTWGASPSITDTSVTGPVGCTTGIFHFQDRIWTSVGNIIYYTDAPTSPGGFPETWNIGANFVVVVGEKGPATIFKIIPYQTRLYIFTNQGLFVLSIYGTPNDWNLKTADSKVKVNTVSCAFELSGIVYYICDLGVFATTGSSTVKLSGSIENFFLTGNQVSSADTGLRRFTEFRIHYLDGGMVISISPQILKNNFAAVAQLFYSGDDCQILYSRTDSVAWSEWEFPPSNWDSESPAAYDTQINAVLAVADNISTFVNSAPLSYVWMAHSRSVAADTAATVQHPTLELFNYDGFQDSWTDYRWASGVLVVPAGTFTSRFINGYILSHFFDGGNPLTLKQFKHAFLDIFMPTAQAYVNRTPANAAAFYWRYRWLTDQRVYSPPVEILFDQPVPDTFAKEFSVVKLWSQFFFRTAQLELKFTLTDNTNYKVKSAYLKEFQLRDVVNVQQ